MDFRAIFQSVIAIGLMLALLTIAVGLALFSTAMRAHAVTYRNDGTGQVILRNKQGNQEILPPNGTMETYYYVDLTKSEYSDLTKLTDLPYANYSLASDSVTATTEGTDVAVDLDANMAVISLITGTIDVYAQSVSNTPALLTGLTDEANMTKLPLDGTFDNIVIKGSGTCQITQYKINN